VLFAFTAWQAIKARVALNDVAIRTTQMVDQLAAGDLSGAQENVRIAQDSADDALKHTRGPVWWTASKLPWIGDDVTAVRTVAEVVEDLTADTVPDLVEAGGSFGPDALNPKGGRINLDGVPEAAEALTEGAGEVESSRDKVRALETDGLVQQVREPIEELQDKLETAASVAHQAAVAAELMPGMLGAEEPRTYLAVFQSNAEIRAQGGLMGAVSLITARDGKVEMTRQGRVTDFGTFEPDFIDLTADEKRLHSTRLSVYPQNATSVPDFPRSAEILTQMWEERNPEDLDGVVSLDPVAMGYLLRGTGPIEVDGQTLAAENAADVLLRDAYALYPDPADQDDFFDAVSARMFDALLGGAKDTKAMLNAMAQAASERRIMLWSTHPDEQEKLAGTAIAGELTVEASNRPEVGVFLNDAAADKLSYYLDYEVDVTPTSCDSDGVQDLDVRLTMTSTVPEGADLPAYVLGDASNLTQPGQMLNTVYLYAPVDGKVGEVTTEGREAILRKDTFRGRPVALISVLLEPGQTKVIDYSLTSGPDQTGTPRLVTTPAATTTGRGTVGDSAC
jgi:hypothetical protein